MRVENTDLKAQQEIPITVRETLSTISSRLAALSCGRNSLRNSLMAVWENSNIRLMESEGVEMRDFSSRIC